MVKLRGIKTLIMNWASFIVRSFDTRRYVSTRLHARVYDKAEVSIEWNWRKEISSQKTLIVDLRELEGVCERYNRLKECRHSWPG